MDCIFCKIVKGDIPSYKVYEDELVYAFLDIHPWSKGHTLIIPKKHFKDLTDIDNENLAQITAVAKQLTSTYADRLGADGFNLLNSSGAAAQQDVFHFHMHLIPRYEDNSLHITGENINVDTEVDKVSEMLKSL